jgi:uncharacterized protein (DUF1800 family)
LAPVVCARCRTSEPQRCAALRRTASEPLSPQELGHCCFFQQRTPPGTHTIRRILSISIACLFIASSSLAGAGREAPPASAPANLTATPGNARITLTWRSVSGATSYRVYRTTTGTFGSTPIATVSNRSYTNTGLTVGTTYSYRVTARNNDGEGPPSAVVSSTPVAPPPAPSTINAVGGNRQVIVTWSPVPTATSYRVYQSQASGTYSLMPNAIVSAGTTTWVHSGIENGPRYYYTVIARNGAGNGPRSAEASAMTEAPLLVVDAATTAAFRLLRRATWGPRPGDVDHVKQVGHEAFVDEQLAAAPSVYPDTLLTQPIEALQQQIIQHALTGPDQLRQRVAWALHKIWVVSGLDAGAARGMVAYQRLFLQHAFGNYRDLMEAVTLNPAMGRYLNMLNNRSRSVTGAPANENYAREIMQLFTLGTMTLNADGTPVIGTDGAPKPSYTEADVAALARILTGWTYGDGDPATEPTTLAPSNFHVPMEAVAAFHDAEAKTFLGQTFGAGASAAADLDHALDVLFNQPTVGPFVAGQLIKQLVTSNPTPAYVRDVAAVFDDNGGGVRGDLGAVVRAILLHPEANASGPDAGKLAEPLLFITSVMRILNATTTEPRIMVDRASEAGQRMLYAPSVFSYFSPAFAVRTTAADGPPLTGPEFQILTSVTAIDRANFVAQVVGSLFHTLVNFDWTPIFSKSRDAAALVDYCNSIILGGRMTPQERAEIIATVREISINNPAERTQTALYLTFILAQVDR